MNALSILERHFAASPHALAIVLEHSRLVADKALRIAASLGNPELDLRFIEEGALLHDIGVARVHAPKIGCFGPHPYVCHGLLGRNILEAEGLPRHALLCERHIGVGLTTTDIRAQKLPLPERDMVPLTLEERLVTLADLFYSKRPGRLAEEKSVGQIVNGLARFGEDKVQTFSGWLKEFRCPHP